MYFKNLVIENFARIRSLSLDFQRGSVGIFGPNGAGKSTLLDAMYVLVTGDWRRMPQKVKEKCINNVCEDGSKSFIYGEVVHGDNTLKIHRGLRPNKNWLVVNNGEKIEDSNKIEETINEKLGIDRQLLDLYVFKRQDEIYGFLMATNAERAKAYQTLCRTEHCEELWDMLGDFLNKDSEVNAQVVDNSDEIKAKIAEIDGELAVLGGQKEAEEGSLLNNKSKVAAEEILRHAQRTIDLNGERKKQVERVERGNADVTFASKDAQTTLEKLNTRKAKVKKGKDAYEENKAYLKAWEQYQKQKGHAKKLNDTKVALESEEKINKPPKAPEGYGQTDIGTLREALFENKRNRKDANKLVANFGTGDLVECPTCGTPVKNLEAKIEAARNTANMLDGVIAQGEARIEAYEEYEKKVRKFERWKVDWEARVNANKASIEALPKLTTPLGDRAALEKEVADYEALLKRLETSQAELTDAEGVVNQAKARLEAAETRLNEIDQELAEIKEPEEKVEKARRRMNEHTAASQNIARIEGQISGHERRKEGLTEDLDRLKAKLDRGKKVRKMAKIITLARDVFHRDKLPREVAQTNLSRMEGDINENLERFGDPFWVETDADLTFKVHKPGEPPQTASWLSTGQRVVLALCFWPAVGSLWKEDLGMLALDEPTANLDGDNRKALSEALQSMAASVRGKQQLIMVTHDENLKSSFDQVIELGR